MRLQVQSPGQGDKLQGQMMGKRHSIEKKFRHISRKSDEQAVKFTLDGMSLLPLKKRLRLAWGIVTAKWAT